MARIFTSGFETPNVTAGHEWKTVVGSPTVQSTVKRSGAYALRCNPTATTHYLEVEIDESATANLFARVYIRIASAPAADTVIAGFYNSGGSIECGIQLKTNRTLQGLGQLSATIGSPSAALDLDTWYRLEFWADNPGASTGSSEFRLNGVAFASHTATTPDIDAMNFFRIGVIQPTTADIYFDDVGVNNTTAGGNQTSWLGEGKYGHLYPVSNSSVAWSRGGTDSGANWSQVDEDNPNDATDYVSSTTSGQIDEYNMQDASALGIASEDSITLVTLNARWVNQASSSNSMAFELNDGTNSETATPNYDSALTWQTNTGHGSSASVDYRPIITIYDDLGAGSGAISNTDLDSYRAKFTHAANTNEYRVSAIWLGVEWVDNAASGTAHTKDLSDTVGKTETIIKAITRSLSDSRSTSETIQKAPSRILLDSLSLSEVFSMIRGYISTLSDTVGNSETYKHAITKSLSETITLVETVVKAITRTRSEAIILVESIVRATTRVLTETALTIVEVFTTVYARFRTFTDSIGNSDAITRAFTRIFSDDSPIVEAFSYIQARFKSFSDSVGITEAFATFYSKAKTLDDTIGNSDNLTKAFTKILTETLTIVETFIKAGTKILTETLTIVETFIKAGTKILTETVNKTETFIKASTRIFSDSTVISETFTTLQNKFKSFSDSVGITETMTKIYAKIISLSDSIANSETFQKYVTKPLTETAVVISEVFDYTTAAVMEFIDSVSVSDTLSKIYHRLLSFSDQITHSEVFVKTVVLTQNLSDTLGITEAISFLQARFKSLTDSIANSEVISFLNGKSFSDIINVTEWYEQFLNGLSTAWKKVVKTVGLWTNVPKNDDD